MKNKFFVVGIGASAGGLEAIQTLFDNIPEDTGMAFVIVQHLSPNYKSMMDELLHKHTKMPIQLAKEGIELFPNNIYLNPKEKNIVLEAGKIKYINRSVQQPLNLPIDLFFHSLGHTFEDNSVGIILSGTGTDGSRGIATIKAAGGTVIVQSPESAKFDGMPVTAINSGNAELIAAPEEIGIILERITSNKLFHFDKSTTSEKENGFIRILEVLYKHSGIDFKLYRNSTLFRRIEKRITIQQLQSLNEYADLIEKDQKEKDLLLKDCLIGVTRFFRDFEAFDALKKNVLPELLSATRQREKRTVRIWVTACSTGEEAYSLAIILDDYLKTYNINIEYKIFATDIDKDSVQVASVGSYPVNHIADIPRPFLDSYFIKTGDRFEIIKRIREKIVFSQHNILKDPPFIKVDLISCRNLLIYLLPKIQYKVLGTLQFGLNKGGFLFLGHSETLGGSQKMYKTIDSQWRIYQNISDYKELPSRLQTDLRLKNYEATQINFGNKQTLPANHLNSENLFVSKIAQDYGPPCLFVDSNYEILYVNGDINDYVEFPSGMPKNNLMDILAGDKLKTMIRNGIRRTLSEKKKIVFKDVPFSHKRKKGIVTITFQKYEIQKLNGDAFLISFEKKKKEEKKENTIIYDQYKLDEFSKQRIEDLETELKNAKQEIQNSVEELETSNEELQASNEELQASNEELQSTNEELQSVNEELYTVNAEVQVKNKELIELNDDVTNILDSTDVGILFLDIKLRIRKFTPALRVHFSLTNDDLGRPISNFASAFSEEVRKDFLKDVKAVLQEGYIIEKEFRDDDERHFLRKTSPFRNSLDEIGGVIILFVDITQKHKAEKELQQKTEHINSIYNTSLTGIYVYNLKVGRNEFINERYTEILGYSLAEINSMTPSEFFNLFHPADQDAIANHMKDIAKLKKGEVSKILYRFHAKNGQWKWCLSHDTGYQFDENGKLISFVGSFLDITDYKKTQEELTETLERMELATQATGIAVWEWFPLQDKTIGNARWKEMLGFAVDDNISVQWMDNMHHDDRESTRRIFDAHLKGDTDFYEVEFRYNHPVNNKQLWIQTFGKVIERNSNGSALKMIGVSIDVTERKQVEIKLKESEENYRNLFSNQLSAVAVHKFIYDDSGRPIDFIYIEGNPALGNILGKKREEYINKKVSELAPGFIENQKDLFKIYSEVAETGKSKEIEYYFDTLNKWYNIKAFSYKKGDFVSISDDVTESKVAAIEIESEKNLSKTIIENSPIAKIIYNAKGDCILVNKIAAKLVGATQKQMLQQNYHKINSWKKGNVYKNALQTVKTGKQTSGIEELLTTFGKTIWMEYTFVKFSYKEENHLLLQFQDVASRINRQNRLIESEARYKNMFYDNKSVMLLIDPDSSKIVDANKSAVDYYGYSLEKLKKMNISEINTLSENEVLHEMKKARNDKKRYFQFIHKLASGESRYVQVYSGKILIAHKEFLYSVIHDNTREIEAVEKLKKQTANLIQSEKMNAIGTFTAGIAHELNNPLMGIMNYAEYCKKQIPIDNKAYPVLNDLIEEAEKSSEIIRSLLSFVRKDSIDSKENLKTNIIQGIKDCLKILNLKIKDKGITIKIPNDSTNLYGNINPSLYQQVFYNLLDNAVYALEGCKTKEITISVKENKYFHNLVIKDTGKGIKEDDLNSIFDPFFTTKPVGKGTGLGLGITKSILEDAGGSISCESKIEKGTIFKLKIPKTNY